MADRTAETQRWDDVPKSTYVPSERLVAMDVDGIDVSVLYPTVAGLAGEAFARLADRDLELACVRAYNDWLIDEWASESDRFVPQCLVPMWPVETSVQEIARALGRGHRGVIVPPVPMDFGDFPHINDPCYDLLWGLCQEAGVPVCFHSGSTESIQFAAYSGHSPALARALEAVTAPVSSVHLIANFLFSPIPQKFPDLQVVFSHTSFGWGGYLLECAEHQFERQRMYLEGFPSLPSEIFRRQCYLVGWYDDRGLSTREFIGIDSLLWSTNFPHATSSWPSDRSVIFDRFQGMDEREADRILYGNAAELYHISTR